jgi:steroid delta-isomerase-like uncharacterized protein
MSHPDGRPAPVGIALSFIDAMDSHRFDAAEALLAPEFQLYLGGQQLDRAGTMAMVRSVYASFADFKHHVEEVIDAGDRVVLRITDRATHTGEFEGVPATGRRIEMGQISIYRVRGGQLVEIREEADVLSLMQQIGALPAHDGHA